MSIFYLKGRLVQDSMALEHNLRKDLMSEKDINLLN